MADIADIVIVGVTLTPNPVNVRTIYNISADIKDRAYVLAADESSGIADDDWGLIQADDDNPVMIADEDGSVLADADGNIIEIKEDDT